MMSVPPHGMNNPFMAESAANLNTAAYEGRHQVQPHLAVEKVSQQQPEILARKLAVIHNPCP